MCEASERAIARLNAAKGDLHQCKGRYAGGPYPTNDARTINTLNFLNGRQPCAPIKDSVPQSPRPAEEESEEENSSKNTANSSIKLFTGIKATAKPSYPSLQTIYFIVVAKLLCKGSY